MTKRYSAAHYEMTRPVNVPNPELYVKLYKKSFEWPSNSMTYGMKSKSVLIDGQKRGIFVTNVIKSHKKHDHLSDIGNIMNLYADLRIDISNHLYKKVFGFCGKYSVDFTPIGFGPTTSAPPGYAIIDETNLLDYQFAWLENGLSDDEVEHIIMMVLLL